MRAHSPLHAHALLEATEPLSGYGERSPVTAAIAAALSGRAPVSALDLAATGLPLGAVLAEVGGLADAGAVRVHRPLEAGDRVAASVLAHLESESAESLCDAGVSLKVAVAGPAAHGVVASLGRPCSMEGTVDRVVGHTPRPWGFTRLDAGRHVVYVVADTDTCSEEAWFQLMRGVVGLVVTVDAGPGGWRLARRAVGDARVAGLPVVVAGAVVPEDVRDELDEVVPVATCDPGDACGAHAAVRLLAETIEAGGQW